jgi:hypothetical protein
VLPDDQKTDRAGRALLLLAALAKTEERRWVNFWIGDESWIKLVNPPTGSWVTIENELPQKYADNKSE